MIQQAIIFLCLTASVFGLPDEQALEDEHTRQGFTLVTRNQWGASPPRRTVRLNTPVDIVIIHHSYLPVACFNLADCSRAMRSMQNFHQNTNGWIDIGYNFAVGSDGRVYEGRGWNNVGAHASNFNSRSIGICLIGNWGNTLPPAVQLQTTKLLIAAGVQRGAIRRAYRLVGHRQAGNTECPGNSLFREISTWERFSQTI